MKNRNWLMMILLLFLSACSNAAFGLPTSTSPIKTPEPALKIVGYYTSWSIGPRNYPPEKIPVDLLTHINYAFATIDTNEGTCKLGDEKADLQNFRAFKNLKEQNPSLRTLISIGGWSGSGEFSDIALTVEARKKFITSCIKLFLIDYVGTFDGIDIDWEYPTGGGLPENKARPEDKHNFTLLLNEFRKELDSQGKKDGHTYLLTIAAPAGKKQIENLELPEIAKPLDWINLMTYDFHGSWEKITGFNAPLFMPKGDPSSSESNADATVQAYLQANVPANKLVLGIPFYGKGWSGVPAMQNGLFQKASGLPDGTWDKGIFDYKDLVKRFINQGDFQRYYSAEARAPWLYSPAKQIFITYDDPLSVAAKADYARQNHLGGLMCWDLSGDGGALLSVLHSRLAP